MASAPHTLTLSHYMEKESTNRIKMELEYPLRSSTIILFQYIATPSGLQSWFADDVSVNGTHYKFAWEDGTSQHYELLKSVTNKYIKFVPTDPSSRDEFLEFRIISDDITGDVELVITEFVDEGEADEIASLWDSAVETLCQRIGA